MLYNRINKLVSNNVSHDVIVKKFQLQTWGFGSGIHAPTRYNFLLALFVKKRQVLTKLIVNFRDTASCRLYGLNFIAWFVFLCPIILREIIVRFLKTLVRIRPLHCS